MPKYERIYKVTFNSYTNCIHDCVSNYVDGQDISNVKYLSIPQGGLLIKESELTKYVEYGRGFESLTFVGSMECE